MHVTALNRFAVKGLSGDALTSVYLERGETFPDDRRFALLQQKHLLQQSTLTQSESTSTTSDFRVKEWLHKEKFLCAFTAPELLAKLRTSYSIQSSSLHSHNDDALSSCSLSSKSSSSTTTASTIRRFLEVRDRRTGILLTPRLDLEQLEHRTYLAEFLTAYSGMDVVCVSGAAAAAAVATTTTTTVTDSESLSKLQQPQPVQPRDVHFHQFGNTSSGWKQRGDTRTLHIINQQTVNALSTAINRPLRSNRFRPNIVVDGPPAFSEFDWIGKQLTVDNNNINNNDDDSTLVLRVISKTVRCRGVSVDPEDVTTSSEDNDNAVSLIHLDVPQLLVKHFPETGPYLGVYAVVEESGSLAVGNSMHVLN